MQAHDVRTKAIVPLARGEEKGTGVLPETKRLLQGSAAGRAAGGGGGAKAETENSRRNPERAAAAAISMQNPSKKEQRRRDASDGDSRDCCCNVSFISSRSTGPDIGPPQQNYTCSNDATTHPAPKHANCPNPLSSIVDPLPCFAGGGWLTGKAMAQVH